MRVLCAVIAVLGCATPWTLLGGCSADPSGSGTRRSGTEPVSAGDVDTPLAGAGGDFGNSSPGTERTTTGDAPIDNRPRSCKVVEV
jgi:hypothetical protein